MGERFYLEQLEAIGTCPGLEFKPSLKRRRKRMAWDDEKKAQAVALYTERNPTPDNSMEIVKEVADELEETVNGVRMILTKAGVYIKKAAPAGKTSGGGGGGTRVSKEDSQNALIAAIQDAGQEVDEAIITKMTGKAAVYFTGILTGIKEA